MARYCPIVACYVQETCVLSKLYKKQICSRNRYRVDGLYVSAKVSRTLKPQTRSSSPNGLNR